MSEPVSTICECVQCASYRRETSQPLDEATKAWLRIEMPQSTFKKGERNGP